MSDRKLIDALHAPDDAQPAVPDAACDFDEMDRIARQVYIAEGWEMPTEGEPHGSEWSLCCTAVLFAYKAGQSSVRASPDNGRVATTQGSGEPQTRTLRSAHPDPRDAEIARLREALRPFVRWGEGCGPYGREDSWVIATTPTGKSLTMGDIRAAVAIAKGNAP